MSRQTPALRVSATRSHVTATTTWNPESLIKVGLILLVTGALLQAFQAPR